MAVVRKVFRKPQGRKGGLAGENTRQIAQPRIVPAHEFPEKNTNLANGKSTLK